MKKTLKLSIIFAFLIVITILSCKKSFLEKEPQNGSLTTESFWQNKDDYHSAILATYRVMTNGNAGGEDWTYVPNTLLYELLPNAGFIDLQSQFQTNSRSNWWTTFYLMVHRANQPIANIDRATLSAEDRKSILAEAKFLRGFAYFNLTRAFGGVPLILQPKSASDSREDARASEEESWKQVISDFTEAAAGLPDQWDANNVGRATKGSALAYLAYANLYIKDWTNAASAFSALEALGKYDLVANPRDYFSEKNENNKESVFEIQFTQGFENGWSTDGSGGGGASNVHLLGEYSSPANAGSVYAEGGGWGGWNLSKELAASFEAGDRRRFPFVQAGDTTYPLVLTVGEKYEGEAMTGGAYTLAPGKVITDALSTKYWLGPNSPTIPGGSDIGCGLNLPQMRYAEVLLNYAEVLAEQNNLADAYAKLNRVRARAGLPAKVAADKITFEKDLLNERRHELFWEANLYFHLSRKKQLVDYLKSNYNQTFLPNWYYWPIPQTELDQNSALAQNPGY